MRLTIGYRHTGADLKLTGTALRRIISTLDELGIESYCTLFDFELSTGPCVTPRDSLMAAVEQLDQSDGMLFYLDTSTPSLGMHVELGYALAQGKPIYALLQGSVSAPYVESLAARLARWESYDDLPAATRALFARV